MRSLATTAPRGTPAAEAAVQVATSSAPPTIAHGAPAPPVARDALRSAGRPLDPATRRTMQQRFGCDFSHVRVHADPLAARAATALHADAYTIGSDIVFGPGRYAPDTARSTRLIAHELAHVLQQHGTPRTAGELLIDGAGEPQAERAADAVMSGLRPSVTPSARGRLLQRQPTPAAGSPAPASENETTPPAVHIPIGASRLTLIPGRGPLTLAGRRFPLPASLRATNALGLGPGPTFVADLDPRGLVANILGSIDLATSTLPGTPPGADRDPANQSSIQLVNPHARLDFRSGRIDGEATLHVPSDYPPAFHPGTDVPVRVESNIRDPMRWRLGASFGPMHANATLRFHYDTTRLAAAASSGPAEVGRELAAPGVSVSGSAFTVLPSWFGLEAATTRPRSRPLLGAPTPFPSSHWIGGVIVAPAGAFLPTAAPALGFSGASFGERSGLSGTAAVVPTFSPAAISAGGPASSMFPVLAFAEISYVNRVSDGVELGVRAVLQVNTAELFNRPQGLPAPEPGERPAEPDPLRRDPTPLPPPISPFGGVTIFGRFNAL
jgi:Domain of unknown function (DUF4157)